MPNGFIHSPNIDVLTLAFTEQGYPTFKHGQFYEGFRAYHLTGHRGYEPEVDWAVFKEPSFRDRESQVAIEGLLDAYAESFAALLSSNPNGVVNVDARNARLAWVSFRAKRAICVGYNLYQRKNGAWLEHIATGHPNLPDLSEYPPEAQQMLRDMLGRPQSMAFCFNGLPYGNFQGPSAKEACIIDISEADEILCASESLSDTAAWEQMAGVPDVFSQEASGLLLSAMRERALKKAHDILVMRWRREARRIDLSHLRGD